MGERYHRILEKKEVFEIIFENSVHNPKIGCWNPQKRKKCLTFFKRIFKLILNTCWYLQKKKENIFLKKLNLVSEMWKNRSARIKLI